MITYTLTIFPQSAVFDKLYLWLPIPYDLTVDQVTFSLKPKQISQEKKFGNKIAYFEIEKEKIKKNLSIDEKFELVKNLQPSQINDFSINDYQKDKNYQKYLKADSYIQSDSPIIRNIAKKICNKRTNLFPVLKDFYDYLLSILTYGCPTFGLYTSLQAFDFRIVDCGGFSTLFCALCQAIGVPVRIVSGFFLKNAKNSGYHAWSELLLPNRSWIPVDLAMAKLRNELPRSKLHGILAGSASTFLTPSSVPIKSGRFSAIKNKDYFGRTYEERLIFCRGTDFSLIPKLPDQEKASILQIYYLRLNDGGQMNNLRVEMEIKIK